ncbi:MULTISPECIES: hypothetical protein [Paraburkholderia]|uniref:hypothetical protein n=1 Tax=Paraburkholderia TaxID=1822464 RepID=UPI0013A6EABE|nr:MULTISPECIES: hypothetical protein [Paraburkholderia]MDH6147377.1 hypothetical protein [Paraburkholderia sp. WSM4179]
MKTKCGLIVAAIAILGACSKQESPQQASTPAPASAPVAAPAPAQAAPAVAATPAPDNTSLSNYEAVDGTDATWLTYISVTHTTSQPAQDELLNLFSAKYYNEHDTFKKHDMIETEWPPIQSNLKHYAAQNYYAVPFGGSTNLNSQQALMLLTNAQPYDFGSKSFPIGSFANASFGNRQNVFLTMNEETSRFGQIKVEDEALARKIEQLRTSGMLSLRGLLYIRVDNVQNGNRVHATLQHMHVDVYDKPAYLQGGGKLVASYDI